MFHGPTIPLVNITEKKIENTSTWFMIFQLKNQDQELKIEKKDIMKTTFGNKMLQ